MIIEKEVFQFLDMFSPVFYIVGIFGLMIFGVKYVNRQTNREVKE